MSRIYCDDSTFGKSPNHEKENSKEALADQC